MTRRSFSVTDVVVVMAMCAVAGVSVVACGGLLDETQSDETKQMSVKNLSNMGRAALTYKIDMKQWPAANGASFWVAIYQNGYIANVTMFLSPGTTDDNSTVKWPTGKAAPLVNPGPNEVSYAGPIDSSRLPKGAANDSLIGSEDSEGPAHFWDGMATVEVDSRAKFLIWPELKSGAAEGKAGEVKVGEKKSRLADLAN
jgi:hypothetical protein